jgi:hypothetical protein
MNVTVRISSSHDQDWPPNSADARNHLSPTRYQLIGRAQFRIYGGGNSDVRLAFVRLRADTPVQKAGPIPRMCGYARTKTVGLSLTVLFVVILILGAISY